MDSLKMHRLKRVFIFVILPLAILLGLALFSHVFGIRINLTSSMPVGIYQEDNSRIAVGSIVSVCLPQDIAKEGLQKGYLAHTGFCDDNSEPVIKEIVGLPTSKINITSKYIEATDQQGHIAKYFAPHHNMSMSDHPVKSFIKLGNQISKGYWLYGVGNKEFSWDSRYFGAVQKNNIISVMKPLWIWSKN
jgi:conjugative transfer signal peptidase TraF